MNDNDGDSSSDDDNVDDSDGDDDDNNGRLTMIMITMTNFTLFKTYKYTCSWYVSSLIILCRVPSSIKNIS